MFYLAVIALSASLAAVEGAKCTNLTIPITASARNGIFNVAEPLNDIDVSNFILDCNQPSINGTKEVLQGYRTVSGHYNISATYCEPDSGPSKVLQILTHGIGFDRAYWDLAFNNFNYSYTKAAVDKYGYSTFTYDRLGTGQSSHGDPINEIQALLEVDSLRALTVGLQQGSFSGIKPAYKKVVHVGHSFGSQHTYALTAMYPNISNAIVLTGFSQVGSFVPFFIYGSNLGIANQHRQEFQGLPNGYVSSGDASAVQYNFLAPGQFDPEILGYLVEIGQPLTYGELLTFGGETATLNHFANPTLIMTGERDFPYCGGNCNDAPMGYPNIPSVSSQYIPNAKPFWVEIVPSAGHGLNAQYSAQSTYDYIMTFLAQNGLGPSS